MAKPSISTAVQSRPDTAVSTPILGATSEITPQRRGSFYPPLNLGRVGQYLSGMFRRADLRIRYCDLALAIDQIANPAGV